MLFMVIERFKNRDPAPIYARLRERGRSMPDGLRYVDSWIEANFDRQLDEAKLKSITGGEPITAEWANALVDAVLGLGRIIGVAAQSRMKQLPNVPTVSETYPDFSLSSWNGFRNQPAPRSAVRAHPRVQADRCRSRPAGRNAPSRPKGSASLRSRADRAR